MTTLNGYIGIDTGLEGAISILDDSTARVADMPVVEVGKGHVKREVNPSLLADLLTQYRPHAGASSRIVHTAVVERTSAMPGQGVASMYSMGLSRGIVLGVLASLGIPYIEVTPVTWKKHFKLVGSDKDASRAMAIRRLPTTSQFLTRKKDHNRAEALLLALYLKETFE